MLARMNPDMLGTLSLLDNECFDKGDRYRSAENLAELMSNNPEGCFACFQGGEMAGYVFTRVLGNVGYLGPLGVKPSFQGRGLGKALIQAGCAALTGAGCASIGLEVLPERGYNLGLYLNSGFLPTFSTLTYRRRPHGASSHSEHVVDGRSMDIQRISMFDSEFRSEHGGYSMLGDIQSALSHPDGRVYFYMKADVPIGFLCYAPHINPYVWGAFLRGHEEKPVFDALLSQIVRARPDETLRMRINSRYLKAVGMMDHSFEVERCILRMMLKGYEGAYMTVDETAFIARSWVG